jgi:hypothetical protein
VAEQDLLLVFTNPVAGTDDEFNRWYDDVHVPEVLAVKGVVAAQRYEVAVLETPENDIGPAPAGPDHRYLVVYKLDRDANSVMVDFVAALASGEMSLHPALDMSTVGMSSWTPHGPERTEGG